MFACSAIVAGSTETINLPARTQSHLSRLDNLERVSGEILLVAAAGGYRGKRRREPRRTMPRETERTTMLNLGRITSIKYGLREIMKYYEIDDSVASTVIASVIAKGSRISIASARSYVRNQEKAGMYPKEASDEICNLLGQYSKLR